MARVADALRAVANSVPRPFTPQAAVAAAALVSDARREAEQASQSPVGPSLRECGSSGHPECHGQHHERSVTQRLERLRLPERLGQSHDLVAHAPGIRSWAVDQPDGFPDPAHQSVLVGTDASASSQAILDVMASVRTGSTVR